MAEDSNVTPPAVEAVPVSDERVALADYKTRGTTHVKARRGYKVEPTDKTLPVIDENGINVTKDQADALMDEAGQYLVRTETKE